MGVFDQERKEEAVITLAELKLVLELSPLINIHCFVIFCGMSKYWEAYQHTNVEMVVNVC